MKVWIRSDSFGVYFFKSYEEAAKPKSCGNKCANEFDNTENAFLESRYDNLNLSDEDNKKSWKEPIPKILSLRNPPRRKNEVVYEI